MEPCRSIKAVADGQMVDAEEGPAMCAYQDRHTPATTERQFQALRTVVASSGLLTPDRFTEGNPHLALLAAAEWERPADQTAARHSAFSSGVTRLRRRLGAALICIGRRIGGTPGAGASNDVALGQDGVPS